jgi:hypothetical protein
MNLLRSEATGGQLTPMLLGTIFREGEMPELQRRQLNGTTFMNNQPVPSSPKFLSDWQICGSGISRALNTVIQ